jgi:hypothetical protein
VVKRVHQLRCHSGNGASRKAAPRRLEPTCWLISIHKHRDAYLTNERNKEWLNAKRVREKVVLMKDGMKIFERSVREKPDLAAGAGWGRTHDSRCAQVSRGETEGKYFVYRKTAGGRCGCDGCGGCVDRTHDLALQNSVLFVKSLHYRLDELLSAVNLIPGKLQRRKHLMPSVRLSACREVPKGRSEGLAQAKARLTYQNQFLMCRLESTVHENFTFYVFFFSFFPSRF